MRVPVFVPAAELADIWPLIEPWLSHVARTRRQRWTSETIRRAIEAGRAGLWLATTDDGTPTGCGVTIVNPDFDGSLKLHVWAAYNRKGHPAREWWPWLVAHAREMGCARITFFGRKGYGRVIPGLRSPGHVWEYEI